MKDFIVFAKMYLAALFAHLSVAGVRGCKMELAQHTYGNRFGEW